ncbi:glycosyltransferase family 2 protein [Ectobacillus sp. sgz5001026]|uniref:glycosyltransferase family 2 protein n=1 Tax=Ectobacillus sp. sgz5001026 TaxID=3242473 RepID=UPI0036D2A723
MLITVVTAVYNGEQYLQECIDSILNQTYSYFEYMIVNDGSTDNTRKILDSIQDTRVKVVHLEKNQGAAACLNLGIEKATGDWIAIQDADDISMPTRLQEQIQYLRNNPGAVGVGSYVECIPGKNFVHESILRWNTEYFNVTLTKKEIYESRLYRCYLCHGSAIFSKAAFHKVGGYNTKFKITYDYNLWTRLFEIAPIEKIPKVLYQYRIVHDSLSHSNLIEFSIESTLAVLTRVQEIIYARTNRNPNCILATSEEKCRFFEQYILPRIDIHIHEFIYNRSKFKKKEINKLIKQGKIDAIITMSDTISEQFLRILVQKRLKIEKEFFKIN